MEFITSAWLYLQYDVRSGPRRDVGVAYVERTSRVPHQEVNCPAEFVEYGRKSVQ